MLKKAASPEVLPWKLSRFGPECAYILLYTVFSFVSLVGGRIYLFF